MTAAPEDGDHQLRGLHAGLLHDHGQLRGAVAVQVLRQPRDQAATPVERGVARAQPRGRDPPGAHQVEVRGVRHAARFERLAASGYFDGLTFHRVVTNYVLQGGSPGANEYTGDAAYTRDELGLVSHWRGTVATSTRGRDTGDGQIFINLADNLHLDHDYTVFGEVVRGMDVTDLVAEGDVITRATVVRQSRPLRP